MRSLQHLTVVGVNVCITQREVREHAMHMLGRETKNDLLPPPPDGTEIARFVMAKQGGPTAENFRLEFGKTHLSPWNKKAAKVFARSFIESGLYTSDDKNAVETAFRIHIKTLCLHYQAQVRTANAMPPTQRTIDNRQAAARRARRKTLLDHRITAAYCHEDLVGYRNIIRDMGPDGMSGDESDTRDGLKRYVIFLDEWRNPEVATWIRVFDRVFMTTKFNQVNRPKRGNWPRIRVPTTQRNAIRSGNPVPGLPRNFYNEEWLSTLDVDELEALNVQQPISLVHSQEVLW
ncbi:hypothetical protein DEU56DRAFT_739579 [Suillus clintonianus]|uniref:uncharacterized protein n=1 Tax=Suillus clintonianus TaxID=1904413 RepID=UPI001B863BD3|nr:uncharacterized protein DEU56DRAFT_739579 [Suillus clintonianus]KAG2132333.1 hypothetical protein DEU56DRAFT_739579 [Suillus clintonianus]